MTLSSNFFDVVLFFLWSLVTGPSFMSISSLVLELWQFSKGLTRNLEIGNTSVSVLSNIWRLGQVRNTKFGTGVSNKILLNAAKYQGYSFYRFWVIQEKPTGCKITTKFSVKVVFKSIINLFWAPCYNSIPLENTGKTKVFFVFSGDIKWESMSENGEKLSLISTNKLIDFVHFKYSLIFFH